MTKVATAPPAEPRRQAATLVTERLVLAPLGPEDADEMVDVLGDTRLHAFTGGHPLTLDELRQRFRRLATGRSADGAETWLNWIVRLQTDGAAVGTLQATLTGARGSQHAEVAWVIGVRWQGLGLASEAAVALGDWLKRSGVGGISANIHPRHAASQRVAARAGLRPTNDTVDGEQVWRWPAEPATP